LQYAASIIVSGLVLAQLSGCAFRDSDGNFVTVDPNGSTVTSPQGVKVYEHDTQTGRSTRYETRSGREDSVLYLKNRE